MKIYKEVAVPASTKKIEDHVVCDFCSKQGRGRGWGDWTDGCFDVAETEISMRTGRNYPEGGSGEKFSCDMCVECFEDKLLPFLHSISQQPLDTECWDT